VVIDDEPRYRQGPRTPEALDLRQVGGYGSVDAFVGLQREPLHVVVLDLCLNRLTGDPAVLHGVRAIRQLTAEHGQRVLVYTADERPEPVARCVAAGAAGYVSKYTDDDAVLALAIDDVGRHGSVVTRSINESLRRLVERARDRRLSDTLEETLRLLGRGVPDAEIARRRHMSVRTVEDHKRKILEFFGTDLEANGGYVGLTTSLGVGPGDIVNDSAGSRPERGGIARALAWLDQRRPRNRR